jgi:FdhD protein
MVTADRGGADSTSGAQPAPEATIRVRATKCRDGSAHAADETVCVEEPLEITVDDEPYYLTMRMPGEDIFLALGLCLTEGVISSFDDVLSVSHCIDSTNRVNVYLSPERRGPGAPARKRSGIVYASCGVCGKELLSDICVALAKSDRTVSMRLSQVFDMQKAMEAHQPVFYATGATHAAALFDGEGRTLASSEDVGRHNALDKAIGRVLFEKKGGEAKAAVLSSRLSYEMVQKAARLGVELIAGVSAPTSLAIDLAERLDITLIGFLRPGSANIYTSPERVTVD